MVPDGCYETAFLKSIIRRKNNQAIYATLGGPQMVGKIDRELIRKEVLATKDFEGGAFPKWSFDANGDTTAQYVTIAKVNGDRFEYVTTMGLS